MIIRKNPRSIHVRREDYPKFQYADKAHWPPKSRAFDDLIASVKLLGVTVPIFVRGTDCLDGIYRLCAAQIAGLKLVPVVMVKDYKEIDQWWERQATEKQKYH